jgi:pimeloyl-ACP methyl ester carboxylesterase
MASRWAEPTAITLPGRVTLSYVAQGNPSGIPVILLHGVTDSWYSFAPVLPYLPRSIRAFAISQRGHGDSERPASYRTRDFADDVAAFMDALGIARAVIVGHSMGATNGQRFAIDYPERTRALVLLGSFAAYRGHPVLTEFWRSAVAPLADPIDPAFVREFQESTLGQPVPADFLDRVVLESLKLPARVWRATFERFFDDVCAPDLGKITAPTLILWGTRDSLCRRTDEDALLAAIPGARLVVYEGAGHALHWEEPARFAADLVAFAVAGGT